MALTTAWSPFPLTLPEDCCKHNSGMSLDPASPRKTTTRLPDVFPTPIPMEFIQPFCEDKCHPAGGRGKQDRLAWLPSGSPSKNKHQIQLCKLTRKPKAYQLVRRPHQKCYELVPWYRSYLRDPSICKEHFLGAPHVPWWLFLYGSQAVTCQLPPE